MVSYFLNYKLPITYAQQQHWDRVDQYHTELPFDRPHKARNNCVESPCAVWLMMSNHLPRTHQLAAINVILDSWTVVSKKGIWLRTKTHVPGSTGYILDSGETTQWESMKFSSNQWSSLMLHWTEHICNVGNSASWRWEAYVYPERILTWKLCLRGEVVT